MHEAWTWVLFVTLFYINMHFILIGTQQFFDELVRRELLAPSAPASVLAGVDTGKRHTRMVILAWSKCWDQYCFTVHLSLSLWCRLTVHVYILSYVQASGLSMACQTLSAV